MTGNDGTPRNRAGFSSRLGSALKRRWHLIGAGAIAVLLRLPGVFNGLPLVRHPDEPINYAITHQMIVERSILPGYYGYPSLQYDLQAVAHGVLAVIGKLLGIWQPSTDFGLADGGGFGTTLALSRAPWLVARGVTVVIATVGVLVAVGLATSLCGSRRWGFFAGVLAATSGIGVATGSVMTPDALMGTTAIVTVACVLKLYSDHEHASSRRWLLCTGAALGLAMGAKYNNALLVVVILVAHMTAPRTARPTFPRLAGMLAVGAAVFLITTPAVVLDFDQFQRGVLEQVSHYSRGHDGHEGGSLAAYVGFLWRGDVLCVVLGVFALLRWRSRAVLTLVAWVVVYVLSISLARVHFDRNLTPILGVMAVLAAIGAQELWIQLGARVRGGTRRHLWRGLVLGASVLLVSGSVVHAGRTIREVRFQLTDYQAAAQEWTEQTVPTAASVLLEPYSPWVDRGIRTVAPVWFIVDVPDEQIRDSDVVVLTSLGSGRYLRDPARYPAKAAKVESLRASACRLERYQDDFDFWVEVVFLRCEPAA